MSAPTLRVAALQFGNVTDVDANLDTVLRMIDTAAAEHPDVMVLPEFCNHLSIYDDGRHAWDVAIDLGTPAEPGPWVEAVAQRAARHQCWIQLNCTVRISSPTALRSTSESRFNQSLTGSRPSPVR